MVAKGEGTQGGIDWKVGVSRCKLLYMHIMDKCKKKYICICVCVCLCVCVCVCVCVLVTQSCLTLQPHGL